ncbi:MAG: hypothetical protein OXC05_02480 [Halieaceae bacterium]|nr:hypothetical protein [Halieaceae bacterium]
MVLIHSGQRENTAPDFRSVADAEELERALEFSWEKWTVFLHPLQRQIENSASAAQIQEDTP